MHPYAPKITYGIILLLAFSVYSGASFFALSQQKNRSTLSATSTAVTPAPSIALKPVSSTVGYFRVTKVVDGDTIAIDMNGRTETLRLIGINTPETVDPRRPVECFGKEASANAKSLLTGVRVRLEGDSSQDARDKYGRMLAYVFLDDGTNFNELMIREGYAYEYTYHFPYKYQREFKEAQRMAKEGGMGLWADGACGQRNISAISTPPPVSVTTSTSGDNVCDKNTYNCSSFTTQKEAQTTFDACGGSANDIHKLDSDKDGVVCEGLP